MPVKKRLLWIVIGLLLAARTAGMAQTANFSDPASMLEDATEGIYVPNFFTPNYDGINDAFYVSNKGITEYSMKIFDRYGVLQFETITPNISWDGATPSGLPASVGTYFYVLIAKSATTDYSQMGKITLLR